MSDTPQDELVRRAQKGDRAALQDLAARWWPVMRRWAILQLGDAPYAEDACQEALIRLIRFLGKYDTRRPFRAWLHAVVRNCCNDVAARRTRLRRREVVLDFEMGHRPNPDRDMDLGRTADRALEAFGKLSPRQRQVFDLCDRQGLTPSQAAEVLDIAAGTARATLFAARKALRARMLAKGPDVLELLRES